MKFQPVIKWSGSKRSQSEEIIKKFPKTINAYYEPFIGGGSVLFQLLHSDIKVEQYICSDINKDLIVLWNMIKDNPEHLCIKYKEMWNELNSIEDIDLKKQYYYKARSEYNTTREPHLLLFLSRTCINGLIRYNSKNEFNASFHFSRKGIVPDKLTDIMLQWSNVLNNKNVQFIHQSYEKILANKGDFVYLDPPYANTKGMYYGTIDYESFWDFLRKLECKYVLSFNGTLGNIDKTYDVPKDVYATHEYLDSGMSSFKKMHQEQEYVKESLYISYLE